MKITRFFVLSVALASFANYAMAGAYGIIERECDRACIRKKAEEETVMRARFMYVHRSSSANESDRLDMSVKMTCHARGEYEFSYVSETYPASECERIAGEIFVARDKEEKEDEAKRLKEKRERLQAEADAKAKRLKEWQEERQAEAKADAEAEAKRLEEVRQDEARREAKRLEEERQAEADANERRAAIAASGVSVKRAGEIAGEMYQSYLYGGVDKMLATENRCWRALTKKTNLTDANAVSCFVFALSGGVIEAVYARQQRRVPVPAYNVNLYRQRIIGNMTKAGVNKDRMQLISDRAVAHLESVLVGLINAGMR